MTRFLPFSLLLLLALSLFAQSEQVPSGQTLPQSPALLTRMREQLTLELQQTQRMLGFVNPNDTQLVATLKAQQTELTKQLRDITQQIQADSPVTSSIGEVLPDISRQPIPSFPSIRNLDPLPGMPTGYQNPAFSAPPAIPSYNAVPLQPSPSNWINQEQQLWDMLPSLPKELIEVKQSVESLQKEIADLKETIKALETQIQLLNRTILLSDRIKE